MPEGNILSLIFDDDLAIADSLAKSAAFTLPENSRQYIRKPAYEFGWDFVPRMMTSGITGDVYAIGLDPQEVMQYSPSAQPFAEFDPVNFKFKKNNKDIYIKGVNLVPLNSFTLPDQHYYDQLIERCKEAHINMIRVWGGGNLPTEYFYDLCDESQIMVWQDLPFANGMYPIDDLFKAQIREEVISIVNRLKHHPCIVLWCGNNEIDEGWHNWGWQKQYTESQKKLLWEGYKDIFESIIPNAIASIDKERSYIPTSPKIGWGKKESMLEGDSHYWGVWWGQEPINTYMKKVPRFMSEYGMQALPDLQSILEFCNYKNIDTDNPLFLYHQKNTVGFATLRHYLRDYPKPLNNMAYIYFTQMLQRDAISTAVMAHRSAQPYNNGTMLWQFNDSWPGITWSILDYYNRPKAAFRELIRLYDSNMIGMVHYVSENNKLKGDTNNFYFTLVDPTFNVKNVPSSLLVCDVNGDTVYKKNLEWKYNGHNVYYVENLLTRDFLSSFDWIYNYIIVSIRVNGKNIEQPFFMDKPNKIRLEEPSYKIVHIDPETIEIQAQTLLKDVYLYSKDAKTTFSENYFTLLPQHSKQIKVTNYNSRIGIELFHWNNMIWKYEE
jgi:beta-mannosidase